MNKLFIFTGLPGAGKSYLISKMIGTNVKTSYVHSPDSIQRITNVDSEKALRFSFENLKVFLDSVKNYRKVYWDQQNLLLSDRKKILLEWSSFFDHVEYHSILPPRTENEVFLWVRRLQKNPNSVRPEHILLNMGSNYSIPGKHTEERPVFLYGFDGSFIQKFD